MIRNNTKKILDEMGITIVEACERTGLHRSIVGRLYRNEVTQIPFDTLDALCRGLNVSSGELFEYVSDNLMTEADKEHLEIRAGYNTKRYRDRREERQGTVAAKVGAGKTATLPDIFIKYDRRRGEKMYMSFEIKSDEDVLKSGKVVVNTTNYDALLKDYAEPFADELQEKVKEQAVQIAKDKMV